MQISKRLETVARQMESGGVVADIGCDHGFTSIFLIQEGLASRAIAMDIRKGPLGAAREHVRQYGLEDKIELRLSDGAQKLQPGEVDTLLISGMGGALICGILEASPEVVKKTKELILSPQSEIYLVRKLVHRLGFRIERETMLVDQGKYYVIIRAVPGQEIYDREEEYLYGRYLLRQKDGVLLGFLERELQRVERILGSMEQSELSEGGCRQRQELLKKQRMIQWCRKEIGGEVW